MVCFVVPATDNGKVGSQSGKTSKKVVIADSGQIS